MESLEALNPNVKLPAASQLDGVYLVVVRIYLKRDVIDIF
jgi:hypothetical protein